MTPLITFLPDTLQNHGQYMITYIYMLFADLKKMRVAAKRTTLILNFSSIRLGFPLTPLSVNYLFFAANAPITLVLSVPTLKFPATPLGIVSALVSLLLGVAS